MKSFNLVFVRSYGDETATYRAVFHEPMTVRELIDYATYRSSEWGYFVINGKDSLEYRFGAVLTDKIPEEMKDKTIREMYWHGGYAMADYHIKI